LLNFKGTNTPEAGDEEEADEAEEDLLKRTNRRTNEPQSYQLGLYSIKLLIFIRGDCGAYMNEQNR